MSRHWKVSEVARMAHVTVRTLHHYDEIGLLVPSERLANGYRLYVHADLERLHQILLLRELGFPLEAIRGMLDSPLADRASALRAQRELLHERLDNTKAVIRAVDRALRSLEEEEVMSSEAMFEGFEGFDQSPYAEEARERWGETDAYKESMRRAKRYSKEDWARIKAEGEEPLVALTALMQAGRRPDEPEALDAADRARLQIDRWFYPCNRAFHVNLAAMYESDARFGEFYESRAEGLRDFVVAAIRANAERGE